MPVRVTERFGRLPRGVTPDPRGQFNVAEQPDPNDAYPTWQRGQTHDPTNPLGAGIGQQLRGMANRQQADYAQSTEAKALGAPNTISSVLPDMRWEGLKQALHEAGADRVQTAGAAGDMMGPLTSEVGSGGTVKSAGRQGFFDVQNPNAQQQAALKGLLAAKDLNRYGRVR